MSRPECESLTCTRMDGVCVGWHCGYCGEPSSQYGHPGCFETALEESRTQYRGALDRLADA